MAETQFIDTPQGRRIAYHFTAGEGPCVVFLGGLKSDMQGTKAVFLEGWAKRTGRAFPPPPGPAWGPQKAWNPANNWIPPPGTAATWARAT